jgi:uncharacterized membrane protein YpjA
MALIKSFLLLPIIQRVMSLMAVAFFTLIKAGNLTIKRELLSPTGLGKRMRVSPVLFVQEHLMRAVDTLHIAGDS